MDIDIIDQPKIDRLQYTSIEMTTAEGRGATA